MSRHSAKNFAATVAILAIGFNAAFGTTTSRPTVSFVIPTAGQHFTNDTINIAGKAGYGRKTLAGVFYQLDGGAWTLASPAAVGWKTWTASVSLDPGTNILRAYSVGTDAKRSTTNSVKFFYDTVQKSLAGLTMSVSGPVTYTLNFGTGTFSGNSDDPDGFGYNGVGTYTNSKISGTSSKLRLAFKSPPTVSSNITSVVLNFDSSSSGWFYDTNGDFNSFTLDTLDTLAAYPLSGTLVLYSDTDTNIFSIQPSPSILDNGNMFKVTNPLVIWIDATYPGNIGDRVSVQFTHLVWERTQWVQINAPTIFGTVINTGSTSDGTDTVTVLFDNSAFVSQTDLFAPIVGTPVNIWSFAFTNSAGTGTGVFTYKVYSPVGALFTATTAGGTGYEILNFDDDSSGSFAGENVDFSDNVTSNTGTFSFSLSSGITLAPTSVGGRTLTLTNSTGFYESANFSNNTTFFETNSYNLTNSSGNYTYLQTNSTILATTWLAFTNGPTAGYTNVIVTSFFTTNSGNFVLTNYDSFGTPVTNYSGKFHLY